MVIYTVRCQFEDPAVADDWVTWLIELHLGDMRSAGASAKRIQQVELEKTTYEVVYEFASRLQYDEYIELHADRLRAKGLAKFPLALGLQYERSVASVVYTCTVTAPPPSR